MYACPICKSPLQSLLGENMTPKQFGVYIQCPNKSCPMQDWGHSMKNTGIKEAYEILVHKCTR